MMQDGSIYAFTDAVAWLNARADGGEAASRAETSTIDDDGR